MQRIARDIRQQSREVAREAQQGVLSLETLKQTNQELVQSLQESLALQRESRAQRAEAEREL